MLTFMTEYKNFKHLKNVQLIYPFTNVGLY